MLYFIVGFPSIETQPQIQEILFQNMPFNPYTLHRLPTHLAFNHVAI